MEFFSDSRADAGMQEMPLDRLIPIDVVVNPVFRAAARGTRSVPRSGIKRALREAAQRRDAATM